MHTISKWLARKTKEILTVLYRNIKWFFPSRNNLSYLGVNFLRYLKKQSHIMWRRIYQKQLYILNSSYTIYVYVTIVIPADCPCLKVRCWHGELHLGEAEYTPKSCRTRQRKKSPSSCYFSSYIESKRHRYCGIIRFRGAQFSWNP